MRLKLILNSVKERKRNRHGAKPAETVLISSRELYFPCLQNLGFKMVNWDAAMTQKRMNFCTEINTAVLLFS